MQLYTLGQISKAASTLSQGWGELPQRVQEAWGYLLVCSDVSGFESEFEIIRQSIKAVRDGDWSGVTNEDYHTVASVITEMDHRSARYVTIKEDVRVLSTAGSGIGTRAYSENN